MASSFAFARNAREVITVAILHCAITAAMASGPAVKFKFTGTFAAIESPTFTTAPTGTSYYYEITATNAETETIATGSLGMANDTSTLNWTQITGATGYKIYRNTSNSFTSGSLLLTTITNSSTTIALRKQNLPNLVILNGWQNKNQ